MKTVSTLRGRTSCTGRLATPAIRYAEYAREWLDQSFRTGDVEDGAIADCPHLPVSPAAAFAL
jgi:hypothetical protein